MENMIAPCGIDCSKCPIFVATKKQDKEAAIKACKRWANEFDSPWCDSCLAGKRIWQNCKVCEKRRNALNIQ